MQISSLAAESGRGAFVLDYVSRYGSDAAMMKSLLEKSPDAIRAIRYVYDGRTGQYRDLSTGKFVSPRDLPWPPHGGFATTPVDTTLPMGAIIDRYGPLTGKYASIPGTSIFERGMAVGSEDMPYTQLMVVKPFTVSAGPSAPVPEFGAIGGGTQYYFPNGIQWWIDNGYLEIVP